MAVYRTVPMFLKCIGRRGGQFVWWAEVAHRNCSIHHLSLRLESAWDICGSVVCLLGMCVRYMKHFNIITSTIPPILHFYWQRCIWRIRTPSSAPVGLCRLPSMTARWFRSRCRARTMPRLPDLDVFPTLSLSFVRIILPLVPPPRSLSDFIPRRFDVCRVVCFCWSARSAFILSVCCIDRWLDSFNHQCCIIDNQLQ